MFCSTIIPTIGRPSLSRSVRSVLEQTPAGEDFEVIVVNDSGGRLAEADWQRSGRVRTIDTNRRNYCVARNAGAALARGTYLHFLDDDDWLLPGALEAFRTLAGGSPQALCLYGGVALVDETGRRLGTLNLGMSGNCAAQLMAGSWIPVQSALIKATAFFEEGGFHPLFRSGEETELGRRLALHGDFANTSAEVVCILRGSGWNTTVDYGAAVWYLRWSREIALSEPGAFRRLEASATAGYWHGRVLKAYMASTLWNLREGHLSTAASRAAFGMASLALSGLNSIRPEYWRAVKDSQVPWTGDRVMAASQEDADPRLI
jgi:glycosyltransferase involved in cell wall biosynthesis